MKRWGSGAPATPSPFGTLKNRQRCCNKCTRPFLFFIVELFARASRARGRSPIAKVIYPSLKIW